MLSAFRAVTIENAALWLDNGSGLRQQLNIGLELRRLGSERQLLLELKGPQQSKLTVSGSGVGDILIPCASGVTCTDIWTFPTSWLADLLGQDLSARVEVNFWFHGDNQLPEAVLVTELTDLSWGWSRTEDWFWIRPVSLPAYPLHQRAGSRGSNPCQWRLVMLSSPWIDFSWRATVWRSI